MIFKFAYEEELKRYLKDNFERMFGFSFVAEELHVLTGTIDLVGEDEENIYLIEIKRDYVTKDTVKQLQRYINNYKSQKNVFGIAVAPKVKDDVVVPSNIIAMSLENIVKVSVCKTSLNLDAELMQKLRMIAAANNKSVTDELEEAIKKHIDVNIDKARSILQ